MIRPRTEHALILLGCVVLGIGELAWQLCRQLAPARAAQRQMAASCGQITCPERDAFAADSPRADDTSASPPAFQPIDRPHQQTVRILLVEDEIDLLRSVARALREEGYAVDTAENGEDAAFKIQSWDYDLVALDVMIPGIDGWELLRRLRRTKKTPVIMLTARDTVGDRVRGLDGGADDYLTKPFDLTELLARIRALIRRGAGQAESRLELGDVHLDLATRVVSHRGEPIALTAREYALVEYLALHRGRVVTRTTLYEHLFDENDSSLSNLLDVHVSNVRKKLGRTFIITRRGHGYCIE